MQDLLLRQSIIWILFFFYLVIVKAAESQNIVPSTHNEELDKDWNLCKWVRAGYLNHRIISAFSIILSWNIGVVWYCFFFHPIFFSFFFFGSTKKFLISNISIESSVGWSWIDRGSSSIRPRVRLNVLKCVKVNQIFLYFRTPSFIAWCLYRS